MKTVNVLVITFNKKLLIPVVEGVTFDIGDDNKELEQFYKLINTDIVEHLSVEINGKEYDLWFDEEGKFKKNVPLYPIYYNNQLIDVVMGNIVVTKSFEGNVKGIPNEEWDDLQKALEEKAVKAIKEFRKLVKEQTHQ